MATSKIKLNGKTVNWSGNTSSSSSKSTMRDSVNNYKKRLKAAGVDAEEKLDKRNAIEKLLNLKEDQNVLFDIFEILNRPQNALFTGIDYAKNGGKFGEGLLEGITGNDETTGKDLLVNNMGMEDTQGKLDLADVLGFGLDVVADPVDWALIPVTGGGSVALKSVSDIAVGAASKGLKTAAKAADKGIDAALALADASKLRKLEKLAPTKGFDDAAEMLTKLGQKAPHAQESYANFKKLVMDTLDSNKSLKGLTGATRKAKNEAEFSKVLQEDYVKAVKDATDKYAEDLAKTQGDEVAEEFLRLVDDEGEAALFNVLEYDRDYSASAARWWDKLQAPSKHAKGKNTNVLHDVDEKSLQKVSNILSEYGIEHTVTKNGKLTVKQKDINDYKNIPKLREAFARIDNTFSVLDTDDINEITKLLDDNNISYKKLKGKKEITITDDINKLKSNKDLKKYADRMGLRRTTLYTDEQIDALEEALQTYQNKFGDYYEARKQDFKNLAEINKQQTGVDLTPITAREGYGRRAYTQKGKELAKKNHEEIKGGGGLLSEDTLGTREYGSALEAQNAKVKSHEASIKQINKQIENVKNSTQENKIKALRKQKRETTKQLKIKTQALDENLKKLGIKKEEYKKKIAELEDGRRKIAEMSAKNLKDKVVDAYTAEGMEKVRKAGDKYIAAIEKTDEIRAILSDREAVKNMSEAKFIQLQHRIHSAHHAELRAQKSYRIQLTRAQAALDRKTDRVLKDAASTLKKSNKYTEKIALKQKQFKGTLDKIDQVTSLRGDTISRLEEKVQTLTHKIENAKNLPPSYEEKRLRRLAHLEKERNILQNENAAQIFDYAYEANLAAFINMSTEYDKGVKTVNEAIVLGALDDPDLVKFGDAIEDISKLPNNYTSVNVDGITKTLQLAKDTLPEQSKEIDKLIKLFSGNKEVYMDKGMARLFNVIEHKTEEANAFVKAIDKVNSMFKKFSTLSPGFQVRNILGNMTNMYLAGMPPHQMIPYLTKAQNVLSNTNDLIRKVSTGVKLTADEEAMYKIVKGFNDAGFDDLGDAVRDLEEVRNTMDSTWAPIKAAANLSMDLNKTMDTYNRMALYMYALDHPNFVSKLGKNSAEDAVKYALMDPSNLSEVEREGIKRLIPFYTFTKQNLMFQATNVMKNTPRYRKLIKFINDAYNDLDEDQYYQYQKESMQIPLIMPWSDGDSNQVFLKSNLPVSDLGEWMSNPIQRAFASSTPLIKVPAEMATGKDAFTGQDLKLDTTEKLLKSMGVSDIPQEITNTTELAEHILSGLGLSNITTNTIKKVTKVLNSAQGEDIDGEELWAEIFRSVVQNTNQDTVENSKLYDEYEAYQELVKELKKQGIDVPTIREMQKSGQIKINKLKNKRTKLH